MDAVIYQIASLQPWAIGALAAGLLVLAVVTAYLWLRRGVWLAEHRGQQHARHRWHWYVQTTRKMEQRRIQREIAQGKRPPSVTLEIHKATHGQRSHIQQQIERVKVRHGKVRE